MLFISFRLETYSFITKWFVLLTILYTCIYKCRVNLNVFGFWRSALALDTLHAYVWRFVTASPVQTEMTLHSYHILNCVECFVAHYKQRSVIYSIFGKLSYYWFHVDLSFTKTDTAMKHQLVNTQRHITVIIDFKVKEVWDSPFYYAIVKCYS